jgi:hypothetical protein
MPAGLLTPMLPAAGMYVMFSNHLLGEPLANRTNVIPHGQGNLRLLIPDSRSSVGFKHSTHYLLDRF